MSLQNSCKIHLFSEMQFVIIASAALKLLRNSVKRYKNHGKNYWNQGKKLSEIEQGQETLTVVSV